MQSLSVVVPVYNSAAVLPHVLLDVLLSWGTANFAAVTVEHDPRRAGASNYTFRKLLAHAVNLLTGFSPLPLQLASWTGFACTALGLAVLAWVLGSYAVRG